MKTAVVYFISLISLLLFGAMAATAERDYAVNGWATEWVGYCTDRFTAPTPGEVQALTTGTRQERFLAHLNALDNGLRRTTQVSLEAWLVCARELQSDSFKSSSWSIVQRLRDLWFLNPHVNAKDAETATTLAALVPLQVERSVGRITASLQKTVEIDRAWLATGPRDDALDVYLNGKRLDVTGKVKLYPSGVVATVNGLRAKALQAPTAGDTLGGATGRITIGALALWLLLVLARRSTAGLTLLVPVWLMGALTMTALTLGVPALRSMGLRHLAYWGPVWQPMAVVFPTMLCAWVLGRLDLPIVGRLLNMQNAFDIVIKRAVPWALVAIVVALNNDAARRSEIWLLMACVTLAVFAARNAIFTSVTGQATAFGWPMVVLPGLCVTVMALRSQDKGSAVLIVGLISLWALASMPRWVAMGVMVTGALVIGLWAVVIQPPANTLENPHAQVQHIAQTKEQCELLMLAERLCRARNVEVSDNTDVFRMLSFAQSGLQFSASGYGMVNLPANGMAVSRMSDRSVRQAPMDYAPALLIATHGWLALGAMLVYVIGLTAIAVRALRTLGLVRTATQHLLAALGGFGLLADALRCLINFGGCLAALPLTGQPFVGAALAPVATWTFFFYLGLCLAMQPAPNDKEI